MAELFTIHQDQNGPTLDATLKKGDGTAQDLTGATVTLFVESRRTGVIWLNGNAVTIVTPTAGTVRYTFTAADWTAFTAAGFGPGMYRAQWNVTGLSPTPVRFPTAHPGYFLVHVLSKVS